VRRPKDTRSEQPRAAVSAEIIERCKQGDQEAWDELVEATYRGVYTLCLRILRDPDDAAEATQDAYLKVWRGLQRFRGESALETWMYRVASNAAISKHRSRKRRRSHESGVGDEVLGSMAASGSVEQEAGAKVEVQALDRALSSLPEHYRSAVVLRDVYGYSTEEIAKQLKISETAAKVRVHRGRKKLKEMLYGGTDR
jgi:RNA polymerase sigma-70 factor, ECF subfamily